jgi:hypothetical protein
MRKVFLAALGAMLLSAVFVESASAQRAWGYRGAAWGPRAIGVRSAGFYGRPGWGGLYGRPYLRPGLGWRPAGYYGWRRPYVGYGWRRPWGLGWGAAGIVAGVTAAAYYAYPSYSYAGYGYPSYGYAAYGYPSCGCGSAASYFGGYGWRY